MKINKQKSNKISRKSLVGIALTIICIVCVVFYLLVLQPAEDTLINGSRAKDVPTVSEGSTNNLNTNNNPENTKTTSNNANSTNKEPSKTPGKSPSQYEGETTEDEPAYNNEQFRIPEEE